MIRLDMILSNDEMIINENGRICRRVSVLRGRVLSQQGLGVVGVRVSVERHPRFGFTLTRNGGWYNSTPFQKNQVNSIEMF